jgi:hypothetical protein
MKEIYCFNSVVRTDFSKFAKTNVCEAIGDVVNSNGLSVKQQDLIVDMWEKFMNSKSSERTFIKLSTREVNFAQDNSTFEQMVQLFELAGHAGEYPTDLDTFVQIVVSYTSFFASESGEIVDVLEEKGTIDKFSNEIELLGELIEKSEALDFDYLVFGAVLDWISTRILSGEIKTKE